MLAGSINNQGERSVSPERGNNLGSFDGPETPEEATDFWMLDEFDAELDAAVDAVSDSFPLMVWTSIAKHLPLIRGLR
jgi:hypothetical protein